MGKNPLTDTFTRSSLVAKGFRPDAVSVSSAKGRIMPWSPNVRIINVRGDDSLAFADQRPMLAARAHLLERS